MFYFCRKYFMKMKTTAVLPEKITLLMDSQQLYTQPDLSLNKLAHILKTNTHYLSEAINQGMKMNFSDYINSLRVNKACNLMKAHNRTNMNIEKIAHQAGFKSRSVFYAAFRRFIGKTPGEYRNSMNFQNSNMIPVPEPKQ